MPCPWRVRGNEVAMPRSAKRTTTQAHIDRMVKRIVKRFQPEQVILFGSHARGDAGPDSDVDLLIVMDFEGYKVEMRMEIRDALHDFLITLNFIVMTREEDAC